MLRLHSCFGICTCSIKAIEAELLVPEGSQCMAPRLAASVTFFLVTHTEGKENGNLLKHTLEETVRTFFLQ